MLTQPTGGMFVCKCDKCGTDAETDETKLEDARDIMRQAGWMEMARTGKPMAKWEWLCTKCKPKPSSGAMPSTPESGPISD